MLKATPGAAIFGRYMLFDLPYIADWDEIGKRRQKQVDKNNWEFYLRGFPSNQLTLSGQPTIAPVWPLWSINFSNSVFLLLCKNCNGTRNTWTIGNPCFCLCLMIPNISLSIRDMNAVFLETTYVVARNKLEERYRTLFAGDNRDKTRQMRVSTWCKTIKQLNKERRQGI